MPTNEGAFRSFSGLHFFLHAVQKVKLCQAQKNNQSFCCVFLQQSVPLHKVLDDMAQGRPIKVAFVKKTWKVPSKEIARAEALREKYYESKDE